MQPSPARVRHPDASDARPLLSHTSSLPAAVSSLSVEPSVCTASGAPSMRDELRLLTSLSAPLVVQNVLYLSQALVVMSTVGQVRRRERERRGRHEKPARGFLGATSLSLSPTLFSHSLPPTTCPPSSWGPPSTT